VIPSALLDLSRTKLLMPVSPSYRAYVLDQLRVAGTITARPMFGGVGLYLQGLFFGLIADDTLYLKVDQENRAEYERAGSTPFRPRDRAYSMHYYELPAAVLEDSAELRGWVEKAVAAARRTAQGQPKRRRTP
jgi:DNA transformation protein and related proteins